MNNGHWTEFEIHQIAFLSSRGWKTYEFVQGWNKTHARDETMSLSDAYYDEIYKDDDTIPSPPERDDTIPAPANPEVGLLGMLEELCDWYYHTNHMFDGLPNDLFKQIADHIGYDLEDERIGK